MALRTGTFLALAGALATAFTAPAHAAVSCYGTLSKTLTWSDGRVMIESSWRSSTRLSIDAPVVLGEWDEAAADSQTEETAEKPNLCDHRVWHNLKVAERAAALRAAGFQVALNVRIRLLGPNSEGYAVADYIATLPESNVYRIGEVKTGGATLTRRQMQHYGMGIAQILGSSASAVGLLSGEFIPVVWTGEDRFPRCPAQGSGD